MAHSGFKPNVIKIILLGDVSTGKTAISTQYVHKTYIEGYPVTLGMDFSDKEVSFDSGKCILRIWEASGNRRYFLVAASYIKHSHAVIITYDITNQESFTHVKDWLEDVKRQTNGKSCAYLLVGTKLDVVEDGLAERKVSIEDAQAFAKNNGMIPCGEVSAKNNIGLDRLFLKAVEVACDFQPALQQSVVENYRLLASSSTRDKERSQITWQPTAWHHFKNFCQRHRSKLIGIGVGLGVAVVVAVAAYFLWPIILGAAAITLVATAFGGISISGASAILALLSGIGIGAIFGTIAGVVDSHRHDTSYTLLFEPISENLSGSFLSEPQLGSSSLDLSAPLFGSTCADQYADILRRHPTLAGDDSLAELAGKEFKDMEGNSTESYESGSESVEDESNFTHNKND